MTKIEAASWTPSKMGITYLQQFPEKDSLSKIHQDLKLACISEQHSKRALYLKTLRSPICTGGQHPERALELKTLWNLARVVGQRLERAPLK
jgi:hypothetical protein